MKDSDIEYIIMCKESEEIQRYAKEEIDQGYEGEFTYAYWGTRRICPKCNTWTDGNYCQWCGKKPKIHDLWYISHTNGGVFKVDDFESIWLPNQEQLQKMFTIQTLSEILESFHWFVVELSRNSDKYMEYISDGDVNKINSMTYQQLWLLFVMRKIFGKVWNGMKWIRVS